MNIFKESFKIYKKNFFSLAFAQLMLFFTSLFFLIFVKNKLAEYLREIQNFQPVLEQVMNTIDATNPVSISQSATIIESLNQLTNNAIFFATTVVPLVLLLLWVVFQGMFWILIKKKKIKEPLNYYLKLGIPTAVLIFIIVKFVAFPADITTFFNTFGDSMLKIFLTFFIALYLLTVYYAVLGNQKIKDLAKRTFKIAIKKIHKFLPLYIPLFINTIIITWLLAVIITQEFTSDYSYMGLASLIILVIITLNISKYYKILFQKVVDRN